MAVKMKYGEIMNETFNMAMGRIAGTPTVGEHACRIRRAMREMKKAQEKIRGEYATQIVEKFSKKGEDGKMIADPHPQSEGFEPVEGTEGELIQAREAFGEQEVELDCYPLTLKNLQDVRVSATDLEALRGMFDDAPEGPGIPQLMEMGQRRRK